MEAPKMLFTFFCKPTLSVWIEKCSSDVIAIIFWDLKLLILDVFIQALQFIKTKIDKDWVCDKIRSH